MKQAGYRLADKLFRYGYPLYFPAYSAWKSIADRHERAFFSRLATPESVIVDVGANIGVYTRFFARLVRGGGCVHAFEPAPQNFARLKQTMTGEDRVILNNAAVGASSGTITLYLSDELNVDHRVFDSGDGRAGIQVPLVALDDYFPPGQRVDLIKIDVQGFELSVLKGAARILRENHDIAVLMEFWPYGLQKALTYPGDILAFADGLGFDARPATGGVEELEKLLAGPAQVDGYCNIVLTRRRS